MSTFTRGLLFYDRNAGRGEFYATFSPGYITWLAGHDGWRRSWASIIPLDLSPGFPNTNLLFYDRAAGQAEFINTNNDGGISLLRSYTDWSTGWDIILPLTLAGTGTTSLLFYNSAGGVGQIYHVDSQGNISLLRDYTGWEKGWTQIVPGSFTAGSHNTSLLFYDRATGQAQFYSVDDQGNISLLKNYTDWSTGWDKILPLDLPGSATTSLLFYDSAGGDLALYSTDGQSNIGLLKNYNNWGKSWEQIISGNFGVFPGPELDLLFYDRAAGQGELFTVSSDGNITGVRSYPGLRTSWAQIVPLAWSVIV